MKILVYCDKSDNTIIRSFITKSFTSFLFSHASVLINLFVICRQCMCCFRDPKNFERFNLITQSILYMAACQLKELSDIVYSKSLVKNEEEINIKSCTDSNSDSITRDTPGSTRARDEQLVESDVKIESKQNENDNGESKVCEEEDVRKYCKNEKNKNLEKVSTNELVKVSEDNEDRNNKQEENHNKDAKEVDVWTLQDKEKLLHFLSKVFLLNFPLYVAYKHSVQSKLEEISPHEASDLNSFCDLHDPEIPVYLLRNVYYFCKMSGVLHMTHCFNCQSTDILPVSVAHAIIAVVCNLKLWLNFRSIMNLFVPLRSKVLKYMCSLGDKDLRMPGIKTMAG